MNKIFDYTNLTFNELIEKISIARFFHLPKMVAEALRKIPSGGGSEPAYKVYTALLSQEGTDAPVATILENTLGEIVWSREIKGIYTGTLLNTFIEDKTHLILTNNTYTFAGYPSYNSFVVKDTDSVRIVTTESPENIDVNLYNIPIEIRVYN